MVHKRAFRFQVYACILIAVLITGMLGLMSLEHFPPLDAFYFIISTISTVGYGDLHPVTPEGKILVIFIIITGVGCFIGLAANSIEYLLDERERKLRLEKLNMIISVFFTEAGTGLIRIMSAHDPNIEEIRSVLMINGNWSEVDFSHAQSALKKHPCTIDSKSIDLEEMHAFLSRNRSLLLNLIENPLVIEDDSFTPLLRAVFHLADELTARDRLTGLPESDFNHLSADISRAYAVLIGDWILYMRYLKDNYPYLFSLAMRTNPFDLNASPIVQ